LIFTYTREVRLDSVNLEENVTGRVLGVYGRDPDMFFRNIYGLGCVRFQKKCHLWTDTSSDEQADDVGDASPDRFPIAPLRPCLDVGCLDAFPNQCGIIPYRLSGFPDRLLGLSHLTIAPYTIQWSGRSDSNTRPPAPKKETLKQNKLNNYLI
jgi:hypothetical protein